MKTSIADQAGAQPTDDPGATIPLDIFPLRVGSASADDGGEAMLPPPGLRPVGASRPRWLVLALSVALGAAATVVGASFGPQLYRNHVRNEWLVDAGGNGDAVTIAGVLDRVTDGAIIRIAPGTYRESLVIARSVHLLAADPERPPQLMPPSGACATLTAAHANITGLILKGAVAVATEPEAAAAPEKAPRASACITIDGGASVVAGNEIDGGDGVAMLISNGATATVRENVITAAAKSAIEVMNGAKPVITGNRIGNSGSVVFGAGGGGTFAANNIVGARTSAILVASGAAPKIAQNTITQPTEAGIFVYDYGSATITANTISGSTLSGVVVAAGSVVMSANEITKAGEHGVLVLAGSEATIDGNTIQDNRGNGIIIADQARARLSENTVSGNASPQIINLGRR